MTEGRAIERGDGCDHKFIDSARCGKCGWQAPEKARPRASHGAAIAQSLAAGCLPAEIPKLPGPWCGGPKNITGERVAELRDELSLLDLYTLFCDAANHMDGSMSLEGPRVTVRIKKRPRPPKPSKEERAGIQSKKRPGHRHRP